MSKVIGFDLDGCLYDFYTPAYRELVDHHGVTLPFYEFWTTQGNLLVEFLGMDSSLSGEFWRNFLGVESLYSSSKALPEDVATLNKLSKSWIIFYLTNRPKNCELATLQWLRREGFPQINNLFVVQGSKRGLIKLLKPDYYLEDRVSNIKDLQDLTKIIVKKQFYNKEVCNREFLMIDRVPELLEIVK